MRYDYELRSRVTIMGHEIMRSGKMMRVLRGIAGWGYSVYAGEWGDENFVFYSCDES
jgi:hypothetical protein